MAVRTTDEAVAGIIEIDEDIPLTPFIETASYLVDSVCSDSDYSDTTLELIERWLAAHCYALRDPRTRSEGVRGITEHFEGKWDLGLNHTRYGQMAMLLDTKGNLKILDDTKGGKIKGVIMHIGGSLIDSSYGSEIDV